MKIPHNKISFDDSEVKAVQNVVASGFWACGSVISEVEKNLADMFGVKKTACVGSGLSALRLALLSLGVGEKDEVLIPAYSCVALANAVLSTGAVPIAVDSEENSFNISSQLAKKVKTSKAKAIIAVNSFGVSANIKSLKELGLPVIEDCSHGFSLDEKGNPKSLISDVAIFSFYATKLIAGGEGGAVLSNNPEIISFIQDWRDYSDKEPNGTRLNDKMTDIEGALVKEQLLKLPVTLQKRRSAAEIYNKVLQVSDYYDVPKTSVDRVWYRYILTLKNNIDLQSLIKNLEKLGISARVPVENWLGDNIKSYPNACQAYNNILSLPLYASITPKEQKYVAENLEKVFGHE